MNCQDVRKFLFAFADGQLSVQANCEVLDHLKMCPQCSAIVHEHQSVRQALRHSAERAVMPLGLESRVRKAIASGHLIEAKAPLRLFSRVRVPAVAAAIVLLFLGGWHFLNLNGSIMSHMGIGTDAPSAEDTARLVVMQHNKCVELCNRQAHQDKQLPRDRTLLARAIGEHFGGQLAAIAPDLTKYGYEFDSANYCCINKRDNCVGAHVMYVNFSNGTRLSVFSLPRSPQFGQNESDGTLGQYRPFMQTELNCNSNTSVIAWNEGVSTYICCGDLGSEEKLLSLVQDVQVAIKNGSQDVVAADTSSH